jgi:small subunit ribosomal protein S2
MEQITLEHLLEAGCHFGHKSERWNPKASSFIYAEKDGIHIIDLVKTKDGLDRAAEFVRDLVAEGKEILFVGTKRQAKGIVKEEAVRVGAPHMTERWIGGFLTNWDGIHRNIQKIIRLTDEESTGAWKKFPKHERVKLARYLKRLNMFYGGVLKLSVPPQAIFVIDVKKEVVAVREAIRAGIPVVGIVDTNSDPTGIAHVIPANDDAVGSIAVITKVIARAYEEGRAALAKASADEAKKVAADGEKQKVKEVAKKPEVEEKKVVEEVKPVKKPRAKKAKTE